jgi:hypothetical protein
MSHSDAPPRLTLVGCGNDPADRWEVIDRIVPGERHLAEDAGPVEYVRRDLSTNQLLDTIDRQSLRIAHLERELDELRAHISRPAMLLRHLPRLDA